MSSDEGNVDSIEDIMISHDETIELLERIDSPVKQLDYFQLLLAGDKKVRQSVAWNTSQDRVDVRNGKVRQRHLELVIAKVMRDRAAAAAA